MANHSFVKLDLYLSSDYRINKVNLDLSLEICTSSVISRHSLLSRLPFEVKELIELIKDLLFKLFFAVVSLLFSILPELLCLPLILPLVESFFMRLTSTRSLPWHRPLV